MGDGRGRNLEQTERVGDLLPIEMRNRATQVGDQRSNKLRWGSRLEAIPLRCITQICGRFSGLAHPLPWLRVVTVREFAAQESALDEWHSGIGCAPDAPFLNGPATCRLSADGIALRRLNRFVEATKRKPYQRVPANLPSIGESGLILLS